MTERVLLDACVLVPQRLSSFLLTTAETGMFLPRWSDRILDETERALTYKMRVDPQRVKRRLRAMREAFPEAAVADSLEHEEGLTCHPKDRHVLAAAIAAGATTLVTANIKDFPPAACKPHEIDVMDPDEFLMRLMLRDHHGCVAAARREAARTRRPAMTLREVLAGLTATAPTFANTLHQVITGGDTGAGEFPAYLALEEQGAAFLDGFSSGFDLTDPIHLACAWWTALSERDKSGDVLRWLTWDHRAFGDYQWAAELLAGWSLASRVHYAVDDLTGSVAFVRFVPEVARSSQVFAPFFTPAARIMTMRRNDDQTWRVWGLGTRMISARSVLAD